MQWKAFILTALRSYVQQELFAYWLNPIVPHVVQGSFIDILYNLCKEQRMEGLDYNEER